MTVSQPIGSWLTFCRPIGASPKLCSDSQGDGTISQLSQRSTPPRRRDGQLTQLRGAPSYAQRLQRANDQLNDAYSLRPASYRQTDRQTETGKGIGLLLPGVVGKRTISRCQVRKQFEQNTQTKYDNIYLDENQCA